MSNQKIQVSCDTCKHQRFTARFVPLRRRRISPEQVIKSCLNIYKNKYKIDGETKQSQINLLKDHLNLAKPGLSNKNILPFKKDFKESEDRYTAKKI